MFDYCIYRLKNGDYTSYFYNETSRARIVFSIFDEPFFWSGSFEKLMRDPNDSGLCGEYVCIKNCGDNVEIESNDWSDDEDIPPIVIKKEPLLKSIDLWRDFLKKGVPEIVIICDKEGTLDVVDRLSRPELYMIDTKKQPIKNKEYEFVLIMSFFFGRYFYTKMLDNDYRLGMLSELLAGDQKFVCTVEQALYNQKDFTLTHDAITIVAKNSHVTIQPHNCYKPENYAITILKTELLNVISQWNKLVNAKAKNIIIRRYENRIITIEEYHENTEPVQSSSYEESKNRSSINDIKTMTLDELKAIHSDSDPQKHFIKNCQTKFGPADEYRIKIVPDNVSPDVGEINAMQSLHNTIQKLIGHKFESLKMIRDSAFYHENPQQLNAHYLKILMRIFNEDNSWTSIIKNELMNPNSSGICNNLTCIDIKKDAVIVKYHPNHNLENFSIEIERQVLLDLINKWEELIAQKYQQIIFTRHEDGTITLSVE